MSEGRRVVYVVGASRGIGAAVAAALAGRGYDLRLTARDPEGPVRELADAALAEDPMADHRVMRLDLADREALEVAATAISEEERLYGLVYVAGQSYDALAATIDTEKAADLMQVNVLALMRLSAAALRPMMRARAGRIVAMGSVTALQGNAGNAAYAATKGAMLAYVRTLAVEVARKGVTVNYVAPGFIDTDLLDPYRPYLDSLKEQIPAGRLGRPEDVAGQVAYLLSPGAEYVTGAYLTVDGGLSAQLVSRRR
jgi:3-oxoacyl-[acyl-carrier protein] reductase